MQFLLIEQTYYSFMNLPHCSCIPYALYITENFTVFLRQDRTRLCETVHSPTHTRCVPSPSLGAHNTHTCSRFITSSLSLMLYYHLLLHNIIYDITLDLCSCAVFHMFNHMSLFLVMCNSLKSWSK